MWGGDEGCAHEWTDDAVDVERGACTRCGAWRGDLGLEPTPELYVAHIVEVFREVRRVLKPYGTLWLNMGDTYAGSPKGSLKGQDKSGLTSTRTQEHAPIGVSTIAPRLKPKDLVGMPWRVARALQEPYYTGSIRRVEDRTWLAAAIEGEGCIYLNRHPVGHLTGRNRTPRKTASFGPGLKVTNGDELFIRRCLEIARVGTVRSIRKVGRREFWEWGAWSNDVRQLLTEIYPHMASKLDQARIAISAPTSGDEAEQAWESLKALHQGQTPVIEFPPPPSLYEPGWWLRSDIIWSKPNPMPESVQGSHSTRHRITIEEYENLSGMRYTEERPWQDWPSDVPSLPPGEVPDRQAALSVQPEGSSDDQGKGATEGREGEAALGLSSSTETITPTTTDSRGEADESAHGQRTVRPDRQGQGEEAAGLREAQGGAGQTPLGDSGGLAGDSRSAQESLPLLPEAQGIDDGSRSPAQQGRKTREGEHRAGVSKLQFSQGEQGDPALVDCPGCPKCIGGYISHLSAGRPTTAHEHLFLLAKAERYYYDAEAIREPHQDKLGIERFKGHHGISADGYQPREKDGLVRQEMVRSHNDYNPAGRNRRTVWEIPTQPYLEAHFAVFPEALVEPCILAGTSERGVCPTCGKPWARVVERQRTHDGEPAELGAWSTNEVRGLGAQGHGHWRDGTEVTTTGWRPMCEHDGDPVPATVLDPFVGSGTTCVVAQKLGRRAVGVDLSAEYLELAAKRVGAVTLPMALA